MADDFFSAGNNNLFVILGRLCGEATYSNGDSCLSVIIFFRGRGGLCGGEIRVYFTVDGVGLETACIANLRRPP